MPFTAIAPAELYRQPHEAETSTEMAAKNLESGARGRGRTADTAIFSRMLYQLSYPGAPRAERPLERSAP